MLRLRLPRRKRVPEQSGSDAPTEHEQPIRRGPSRQGVTAPNVARHGQRAAGTARPGRADHAAYRGRSGCSTSVLYTMFGAKAGIAEALWREGFDRLSTALDQVTGADPLQRLAAMGRAYRANALANRSYYAIMFQRPIPGFQPSPDAYRASLQSLQALTDSVADCVRAGVFRPRIPATSPVCCGPPPTVPSASNWPDTKAPSTPNTDSTTSPRLPPPGSWPRGHRPMTSGGSSGCPRTVSPARTIR